VKRKLSFLAILWWLLLSGMLGIGMLLFADRASVASEDENRMLAAFPSPTWETLRQGGYDEAFEDFLCDKFLLRTQILNAVKAAKHVFSALSAEELLYGDTDEEDELLVEIPEEEQTVTQQTETAASTEETEQQPQETAEEAQGTAEEAVAGAESDTASVWLEKRDGTQTALLTYSRAEVQSAADVLSAYAEALPEGGAVRALFAPRAQTANQFALHTDTVDGWSSDVESMLSAMVSDGVEVYSAVDILGPHILSGEYVYFRTDHHWTTLGAYYAAKALLEGAGYLTVPLESYSTALETGFLGSIYLKDRNAKLKSYADTVTIYEPLLPASSFIVSNAYRKAELPVIDETQTGYKAFLGGTHGPYRVLDGGYQTGHNALLICDSFGNAIAQFLATRYDSVYMVDFRPAYYSREAADGSVTEYIRRCGITDIYVVLSESDGIGTRYVDTLMPENLK